MKITNYNIILGSNSPRRREILSQMGIEFEVRVSDKEELYPENLKKEEVSEFLAIQKANNLRNDLREDELLITSDTIVLNDGEILNKPKNEKEAKEMLQSLSAKTHKVITSVCLLSTEKIKFFSERTNVTFSKLSDEIIQFYIENYNPFDKAGSYGIQEWIGYIAVEKIEGSYNNVVGFPSSRVFNEIRNF
jgi:septum formation protein